MRRVEEALIALPARIQALAGLAPSQIDDESRPPSRGGSVVSAVQPPPATSEKHSLRLEKDILDAHAKANGLEDQLAGLRAASDARVQEMLNTDGPDGPPNPQRPPTFIVDPPIECIRHSTDGTALEIIPGLQATISQESLSRVKDGAYQPTADDKAAHAEFLSQQHRLNFLAQEDVRHSFLLFDPNEEDFFLPPRVMTDSGADLYLMVSRFYAQRCGLSWETHPAYLVGVGGTGGAEGLADRKVTVQFGSDGEPGDPARSQTTDDRWKALMRIGGPA
jgi:hypothetical protein